MGQTTGESFSLSAECLRFQVSRSSGPGGQHVNKTSTRVSLIFDLDQCAVFSEFQKRRIRKELRLYLNKDGTIQIHCQESRSQLANKQAVQERLERLIASALKPRKTRKKTRVPRGSVERRLRNKRRRSEIKRLRKRTSGDI